MDDHLDWPDFPVELLAGNTSRDAGARWDAWVARAAQVAWHGPMPALPGVDMVVRLAEARAVLTDDAFPQHFTGLFEGMAARNPQLGADFLAIYDEMRAVALIDQDGDRHRALRALFAPGFGARRIDELRPWLRDQATGLAAALRPGADLMAGFAAGVTGSTLCHVVGVPEEDRDRYLGWVRTTAVLLSPLAILALDAGQAAEVVAARQALVDYSTGLVTRRREEPGDDLASRLATDPSGLLDDRALGVNLADFVFGGHDNTRRSLGQMVLTLADHPDVWDLVAAEPDRAVTVVEECLRYRPASPGAFRHVTRPTTCRDATFPAGQVLWLSTYAASRDERVFADPTTFDPDRPNAREHLGFGHGPHFCIGAHLARAVLQESLRALTATMTCPEIGDGVVLANEGSIGPVSLPVTFRRRGG